jgi:hypothetical protein
VDRLRRLISALGVLSAALATVIACVIVGKALGGLIVVGILATTWSMFFRPIHRRKYREAIADLPSWKIKPE